MSPLPLMLFAAGFGTRMKPLTDDRPKPLIEVAGKPLVDHALDLAQEADCTPIVANLHYRAEQLEHHLAGTGVVTLVERPDILDTGGGLRNALGVLGGDTVVTMNTDAIWSGPNPIDLLQRAWEPDRMDALLICIQLARATGYNGTGDFTLGPDGRLIRGPGVLYGGVQIKPCIRPPDAARRDHGDPDGCPARHRGRRPPFHPPRRLSAPMRAERACGHGC